MNTSLSADALGFSRLKMKRKAKRKEGQEQAKNRSMKKVETDGVKIYLSG